MPAKKPTKKLAKPVKPLAGQPATMDAIQNTDEYWSYDAARYRIVHSGDEYMLLSYGSDNTDITTDIQEIRRRMRATYRNNVLAKAIIQNMVHHILLDGFKFYCDVKEQKDLNDLIEKEFKRFAANVDATGEHNLEQLIRILLNQVLINGDCFALFCSDKKSTYHTKVRVIEPDRVNTPAENTDALAGIERDNFGDKIAVWFVKGASLAEAKTKDQASYMRKAYFDSNGFANIVQVYNPEYIQQVRGVPILTASYNRLLDIDKYVKAEVMAAFVASNYNIFIETPFAQQRENALNAQGNVKPSAGLAKNTQRPPVFNNPGAINVLLPGESVKQMKMERPASGFTAFIQEILGEIASSIGMSHAYLFHQSGDLNFASSRFDANQCQVALRAWRDVLKSQFLEPLKKRFIYELFAEYEDNDGNLIKEAKAKLPDGMTIDDVLENCGFRSPTPMALDLTKEILASANAIKAGLSTRQIECERLFGTDYEAVLQQLSREYKEIKLLGIPDPNLDDQEKAEGSGEPPTEPPKPGDQTQPLGKPPGDNSTRS